MSVELLSYTEPEVRRCVFYEGTGQEEEGQHFRRREREWVDTERVAEGDRGFRTSLIPGRVFNTPGPVLDLDELQDSDESLDVLSRETE